ncbi:hypothetical protein BTA51_22275 [Hahella sp. CCB-MM4]|uniref:putative adhesin n=1 Tax=Hahella sp. (strain CCB-MM4) TaxID=1926491 RepID=UPI000B9C0173|nr:hypothetical protein [Hahella sp. CCB-MM4]OZG71109.1 hypothetical protein BTA51_22275 [Hahella sp. CCB-MM4]
MPMTVPENSVFLANTVGSHIYAWTKQAGKATSKYALISAHGAEKSGTPKRSKTNVNLKFFVERGYTQGGATDIRKAVSGYVRPREATTLNDLAYEYTLSKYQGRHQSENSTHQSGETYGYISKHMHDLRTYYRDVLNLDETTVRQFLSQHKGQIQMDVITIRNRKSGTAPTFSEAILLLQGAGYNYETIFCSFCRGYENGTKLGQQEPINTEDCILS